MGATEPAVEYIRARRALLDALEALAPHAEALVLVGAQAIYLHAGASQLAVAAYTTDADLAVSPDLIGDAPLVDSLLIDAGFYPTDQPGRWVSPDGVYVDLMVPDALAGAGSRGADLGAHGRWAARRARGLEAALVDNAEMAITALEQADERAVTLRVAGPGALLVAKTIKIAERLDDPSRAQDKDALDVVRLLQAIPTEELASRLATLLNDERSAAITAEALTAFEQLFSDPQSVGTQMAVQAATPLEDPDVLGASTSVLAGDLLDHLESQTR